MSRELKGKLSGKTKAQRAAIFAAAAKRCSGKTSKRASKPTKQRTSPSRGNPTGGTRTMAKNSFNMSKIYSLANKVAFVAPYAAIAMNPSMTPAQKVKEGVYYLSGFDMGTGQWHFDGIKKGWTPYVVTKIVTSIVPRLTSFFRGLL